MTASEIFTRSSGFTLPSPGPASSLLKHGLYKGVGESHAVEGDQLVLGTVGVDRYFGGSPMPWPKPCSKGGAMAVAIEIESINRRPRDDPHIRIQHVGGTNPTGNRWKITEDEAIDGTERGDWTFYVDTGGRSASAFLPARGSLS